MYAFRCPRKLLTVAPSTMDGVTTRISWCLGLRMVDALLTAEVQPKYFVEKKRKIIVKAM